MAAPSTTFGELKRQVAGYLNRPTASFVVDGLDLLSKAVYRARLWAQLNHNFEYNRCAITIPDVSTTSGASLSTAVLYGTETAVPVKTIETAYLPVSSGGAIVEIPIGITQRRLHALALRRKYAGIAPSDVASTNVLSMSKYEMVQVGRQIYIRPADTATLGATFDLHADAVRWSEIFTGDNDSDFFLQFGESFMLYRSLVELNFFLKEDERVQISAQVLQDAWNALLAWDTSLVKAEADYDLA